MSFGVHKSFVRNKENGGVIAVPLAPIEINQSAQVQLTSKLKYQEPTLQALFVKIPNVKLTNKMHHVLLPLMSRDLMSDEVKHHELKRLY